MITLGLSGIGHDAAAALIIDGKLVAAIEEERITRLKNAWTFPSQAIKEVLKMAGIRTEKISQVAFYWDDQSALWAAILSELKQLKNKQIPSFKRINARFSAAYAQTEIKKRIQEEIFKSANVKGKISFLNHHLCHIAYAFFSSPFESSAGLVIDGRGEIASITAFDCNRTNFRKLYQSNMPHSLGYIYGAITQHLGFSPLSDEYRIMGLSPYGKSTKKIDDFFASLIKITNSHQLKIDMKFCNYQYTEKLEQPWLHANVYSILGMPRRPEEEITEHHANIAYSLQQRLEAVMLTLIENLYHQTKAENLVLSGGVAMNSVCNQKVKEKSNFKHVFIPPAPSDQGCAIGAALLAARSHLYRYQYRSPYLGPTYSNEEIEAILIASKLPYIKLTNLSLTTAKKIAEGKICGFFQGRMEFGARALGNRSILADPRLSYMRDKINEAVKYREKFRPFAATILSSHLKNYSTQQIDSPYMSFVSQVALDKQSLIPAVTHVDGTCRFQTLKEKDNPLYYNLIQDFYKLTNIPLVLNTSFNVKGEPIVMSPQDAIKCFYTTGIDVLIIGHFMLVKG